MQNQDDFDSYEEYGTFEGYETQQKYSLNTQDIIAISIIGTVLLHELRPELCLHKTVKRQFILFDINMVGIYQSM